MAFGGWMMKGFGALARLKGLRGTPLDLFGYTHERRRERALRDRYLAFARDVAGSLTLANKAAALKLAQLPEQVRGYGHVKLAAMDQLDAAWEARQAEFLAPAVMELKRQA